MTGQCHLKGVHYQMCKWLVKQLQVRRMLERLLARHVLAALGGLRRGGLRGTAESALGALLGTLRLSTAIPSLSVSPPPCRASLRWVMSGGAGQPAKPACSMTQRHH